MVARTIAIVQEVMVGVMEKNVMFQIVISDGDHVLNVILVEGEMMLDHVKNVRGQVQIDNSL